MPTSGLLTQKEDSPAPTPGETRRFSIEQRQKKSGDGTWTKLKNEGEGYGAPYKILKAEKTDYKDQHGNVSYSILCEEEDAGAASSNGVGGAAPATSRNESIERQTSAKIAGNILAALIEKGAVEKGDIGETLGILTDEAFAAIHGSAEGKSEDKAAESYDADVPF